MKSAYKSSPGNKFDMRYRHLNNLASAKRTQADIDAHNAHMRDILGFYNPSQSEIDAYTEHKKKQLGLVTRSSDEPVSDPTPTSSGVGAGSPYGGSSPVTYSDWSPAAKMFGMDSATAYEEHLANTAHQREVADLRAAGLNPVLGLSSGAPTVSGSYVGGSGYGSSAKKTSFKNIADVIGSIAGMIVLAKSKNKYAGSWAASMTSKAFSQAGKLLDDVLE